MSTLKAFFQYIEKDYFLSKERAKSLFADLARLNCRTVRDFGLLEPDFKRISRQRNLPTDFVRIMALSIHLRNKDFYSDVLLQGITVNYLRKILTLNKNSILELIKLIEKRLLIVRGKNNFVPISNPLNEKRILNEKGMIQAEDLFFNFSVRAFLMLYVIHFVRLNYDKGEVKESLVLNLFAHSLAKNAEAVISQLIEGKIDEEVVIQIC